MILIFTRVEDYSTKEICLWLKHLKKKYLVVYHHTLFELVELTDDFNFKLNDTIYTINQFTTIWFRRGWFQFKYIDLSPLKNSLLKDHINHIEDQIETCKICEYRYICSDCRAFTINNDLYQKPLKCNYNPQSMKWKKEA